MKGERATAAAGPAGWQRAGAGAATAAEQAEHGPACEPRCTSVSHGVNGNQGECKLRAHPAGLQQLSVSWGQLALGVWATRLRPPSITFNTSCASPHTRCTATLSTKPAVQLTLALRALCSLCSLRTLCSPLSLRALRCRLRAACSCLRAACAVQRPGELVNPAMEHRLQGREGWHSRGVARRGHCLAGGCRAGGSTA